MRIPNFEKIKEKDSFLISSYATGMHPVPQFYKYYWWVFWEGSVCDGREFLCKENRMSTKKAFDLIEQLKKENKPCWVYNARYPRLDPKNPFDPKSDVWRNVEWMLPLDQDTDEEYKGHR
jgi:hypothetical protein